MNMDTTSARIWRKQKRHSQKRGTRNGRFPIVPLYFTAILGYAFFFSFWQYSAVPLNVHLIAILVAATSFAPISLWYAGDRDRPPVFEIIVLSYALQFSIPVYTQPNVLIIFSSAQHIAWEDVYRALWYVEAGTVSLIIAYYLAHTLFAKLGYTQIDLLLDRERRTTYLLLAIGSGLLIMLLDVVGWLRIPSLGALIGLATRQAYVAIILLAYDVFRKTERRPRMIFLLYGTVGSSVLIGLTTGLLENAMIPLVLLFVVRWHVSGRVPWAWAVGGLLLYLVLSPAKFDYRSRVWYGGDYSFVQRVGLWQDLFVDSVATLLDPTKEAIRTTNTSGALARFDLIHRFAYVQKLTPTYIPYYQGETYQYFLYAWIPRLIWPNKPSASIANDTIDIDYRLKPINSSTTYGIGHLPEAYANFGLAGIIGVLALQGIIFALLDHLFNGRNSNGGRAIYLSVMVYFLNGIGSSSVILFGALFQQILVNVLLLRQFCLGFATKEVERTYNTFAKIRKGGFVKISQKHTPL